MDPITIRYRLTRAETVSQLFRLMVRPKIVGLMLFVALSGIVGVIALPHRPMWTWAAIVFPLFFVFFYYRTVKSIVTQHPEMLEEQTLTFDEAGVTFVNSTMRVALPWQRVKALIETKDYYILRLDTLGSGGVVPRRALSSDEQKRFVACAQSRSA